MRIDIQSPKNEFVGDSHLQFEHRVIFEDNDQSAVAQTYVEDGIKKACFIQINGSVIEERSSFSPIIFLAESHFLKTGITEVRLLMTGGVFVDFPCVESLAILQQLEGSISLECELSRYDGPIAGFISSEGKFFWFDWCQCALDPSFQIHLAPRVLFAREIPEHEVQACREWIAHELELQNEFKLAANPHIFPVRDQQKKQLRSLGLIEDELSTHSAKLPKVDRHPISAWFRGLGDSFAAVQVLRVPNLTSKMLETWQLNLAQAIEKKDQEAIEALIKFSPLDLNPLDIFRVRHKIDGGLIEERLHGYDGQPINDEFFMTAKHRIHDLTSLLHLKKY